MLRKLKQTHKKFSVTEIISESLAQSGALPLIEEQECIYLSERHLFPVINQKNWEKECT